MDVSGVGGESQVQGSAQVSGVGGWGGWGTSGFANGLSCDVSASEWGHKGIRARSTENFSEYLY